MSLNIDKFEHRPNIMLLCGHWTVKCVELQALFNDISWTSRFIDVLRSKRLFTGLGDRLSVACYYFSTQPAGLR